MSLNPNAMVFSPGPPPPAQVVVEDETRRSKKRKKGKGGGAGPTPTQVLMREVGQSCKENDISRGLAAYRAARDAGTPLSPPVFNTLLALVSGLSHHIQGGQGTGGGGGGGGGGGHEAGASTMGSSDEVGSALPTEVSAASATVAAAASTAPSSAESSYETAMELYRDATTAASSTPNTSGADAAASDGGMQTQQQPQHLLQEPAYTSLIRVCGARGDVAEGKRLLSEMQALPMSAKATPRLRTFLPLLEACVAAGDTEGAFEMYDLIRAPPLPPGGGGGGVVVGGGGLMVGEREYVLLLKAATAGGNVEKANLVLRSLAEDVLRPSKTNTWPAIEAWFKSPAAQTSSSGGTSSGPWKWKVLRGVAGAVVDPATGACLDGSGCVLQSVDLSSTQKRRMLAQVEAEVLENSREKVPGEAAEKWQAWRDWLTRKGRRKFDVLVDGANVGYYKQNYAGAPKHVSFEQIDWVMRHYQSLGHRPLLILHQRHLFDQNCPKQYAPIIERWREEKIMYNTPSGANDDWYWLYAALWFNDHDDDDVPSSSSSPPSNSSSSSDTAEATAGAAAAAAGSAAATAASQSSSSSSSTVWLISNDEMRDHHFRMPSTTVSKADVDSFQRWKERHQVTFTFGAWDNRTYSRPVLPLPPTPFSICMQATLAPPPPLSTPPAAAAAAMDLDHHVESSSSSSSSALERTKQPGKGGDGQEEEVVAWHVPCANAELNATNFVGHAYSNAEGFAATSKPVDPGEYEWLCIFREPSTAATAAAPQSGK